VIRLFRLLGVYAKRSFLAWFVARSFLFTLVINQATMPLLGFAVWSAALPGRADVSTYYVAILAVQLLTVSYEYHTVSQAIYGGELNDDLLRPHPAVLPPLGTNLAMRLWHLLVGLPILAFAVWVAEAGFGTREVLLALPAVIGAAALQFLFTYSLALSAIWTQQAGGITGLGSTLVFLLGGMAAPAPMFPEQVRPLIEVLPFRAMLGFPAELASGMLTDGEIVAGYSWQLAWLIVLVAVANRVWTRGTRHYLAVGG
jgi:ABC-2 type transport system permease protein